MDPYRELRQNLHKMLGPSALAVYQGIVTAVDEQTMTCSCRFGDIDISEIRLRASLTEHDRQMLIVPKVGTAAIVGSLSGDLSEVVVLAVDEVEKIILNGGQLGGLINIEALTQKINDLVDAFNKHTHTLAVGSVNVSGAAGTMANAAPVPVPKTTSPAVQLDRKDYEDETITH